MKHLRNFSSVLSMAALALVVSLPASAQVVTFEDLSIDNLGSTGVHSEAGFDYQATGAGWEIQEFFGNPASALATFFNGQGSASGDTVDFTKTGGGIFDFLSVDFSTISPGGSDQVSLIGFLNGNQTDSATLNTSTASPNAFSTVTPSFAGIDLLRVIIIRGTADGSSNAMLLDNFTFSGGTQDVPEPSSLAMLGAGMVGMGGLIIRRKKTA